MRAIRKTRLTTEKDCQVGNRWCIISPACTTTPTQTNRPTQSFWRKPERLWPPGDMSGAFSQAWQACLIEPLDQVSSGLMEEAAKRAEPGLATIARAVLAARQDAISLLVPGQRISSTATLLPESGPAGDMAAWVESWKEAIRLARQREGN